MTHDWVLGLSLGLTAFAAALAGAALLAYLAPRTRGGSIFAHGAGDGALFVFDGEALVDASPEGRALLAAAPVRGNPWQRLMAFLAPRFPDLDRRLGSIATEGRFVLNGAEADGAQTPMTLIAEWRSGLLRIQVADPDTDGLAGLSDPLTLRAMDEELRLLRGTVAQAPLPIWLESDEGAVVWANTAYLALSRSLLGPEPEISWPLPRVMAVKSAATQRVRAGASSWFEAHVKPADGGRMVYALPIDGLIEAEASLRDFTQTLTKTFAHLPIGLAVFDRRRRLALFNPALTDLTGLPVDFLAAQPLLFHVLDRMRERQMLPEPKDYVEWRQRIIDLEKAAAAGLYMETWNLPGGQTYRVIARPHPDGALAMLFEDISTETTRVRRFRADLELGQSVIDAMEEAVVVFSPSGQLVMSNASYTRLWGHDPAASMAGDSAIGAMADYWRARSAPTMVWSEAEDFVARLEDRLGRQSEIRLTDGRLVDCRFVPLAGGATMIGFGLRRAEEVKPVKAVFARAQGPT